MTRSQELAAEGREHRNRATLRRVISDFGWLYKIRPQLIAEPLYRLVGPRGGRAIVEVYGARVYLDPFTTSGHAIVLGCHHEADLVNLIRMRLPSGGSFVDVGANEGLISAIAASIAGKAGLVVAVEPQDRLQDVLEINIALNSQGRFKILRNVVSERDGEDLELNLGPLAHSGGSSLVRAYKWGKHRQPVQGRTLDSIIDESGLETVDFVKVDVEGYEGEVINSGRQSLARHRIATLAIDFHGSILAKRGIDPVSIDAQIRGHGYKRESGDPSGGFCVYSPE